jgi:presenilin-like A22 family membrane protease
MHIPLTAISLVVIPFSIALPIIYIFTDRPWYITNILSFSFAVSSISVLRLDGFKTGGALLIGLFFYDIFWVFGTPVMVTVAKNLDAPIKVGIERLLRRSLIQWLIELLSNRSWPREISITQTLASACWVSETSSYQEFLYR